MNKLPILLVKRDLLQKTERTLLQLQEIELQHSIAEKNRIVREGLFVLALSVVEVMILDLLKEVLHKIPGKMTRMQMEVTKEELIDGGYSILANQIEKELNSISYQTIDEMIVYCRRVLSIKMQFIDKAFVGSLREMKETRNLLVHNNLIVNSRYLAKAGEKARAKKIGDKIKVDWGYYRESIELLNKFCSNVSGEITIKYHRYTKVEAIRKLWNYLFPSPIMNFEEYWIVNKHDDTVRMRLETSGLLAHSEEIMLGVWRALFCGDGTHMKNFSMYSLDEEGQKQLIYLLTISKDMYLY